MNRIRNWKYRTLDTSQEPYRGLYGGNSIKDARKAAATVAVAKITVRSGSGHTLYERWENGEKVSE
jgi:hypothetical protein